jgi:hypothetical protein
MKPYAQVNDLSQVTLASAVQQHLPAQVSSPGSERPRPRPRSTSPPRESDRERRREGRRDRERGGERERGGRERERERDLRDSRDSRDSGDSGLFRRAAPRAYEEDYERLRRERSRTPPRSRSPPPRERRRESMDERSYDRPSAGPAVPAKQNVRQMYGGTTDDAAREKLEKKLRYQEELKAQMREQEEAKRLQKAQDRAGVHVTLKPNSNASQQQSLVVPYSQPSRSNNNSNNYDDAPRRSSVDRGGYGQQQLQREDSHRRGSNAGRDDDEYDDIRPQRNDQREQQRFQELERFDRSQDRDRDQSSVAGGFLEALDMFRPRGGFDQDRGGGGRGYENGGGGRPMLYDEQGPPRQVQWAPQPDSGRSGQQQLQQQQQQQQRGRGNFDDGYNNNNNSNNNSGSYGQQPSVSALKSDLRAGLSQDQAASKADKTAQYAVELRQQMEANLAKKKQEEEKKKAVERREEAEAANYNPWGKGGAGAPVRDQDGKIITNRKQAVQQAENGTLHSPTRGQQQPPQQDYQDNNRAGGGYGNERNNPYSNNHNHNNTPNEYTSPTSQPQQQQPAYSSNPRLSAGSGPAPSVDGAEERHTRFKFSDMVSPDGDSRQLCVFVRMLV